jgi:hypothetical protein
LVKWAFSGPGVCNLRRLGQPHSGQAGWATWARTGIASPLGNYLIPVDYTGCLFREGKAAISAEVSAILKRLGTTVETWQARLDKLSRGRLLGRFFAASRDRLRTVAAQLGVHHLANLGGCPARLTA